MERPNIADDAAFGLGAGDSRVHHRAVEKVHLIAARDDEKYLAVLGTLRFMHRERVGQLPFARFLLRDEDAIFPGGVLVVEVNPHSAIGVDLVADPGRAVPDVEIGVVLRIDHAIAGRDLVQTVLVRVHDVLDVAIERDNGTLGLAVLLAVTTAEDDVTIEVDLSSADGAKNLVVRGSSVADRLNDPALLFAGDVAFGNLAVANLERGLIDGFLIAVAFRERLHSRRADADNVVKRLSGADGRQLRFVADENQARRAAFDDFGHEIGRNH